MQRTVKVTLGRNLIGIWLAVSLAITSMLNAEASQLPSRSAHRLSDEDIQIIRLAWPAVIRAFSTRLPTDSGVAVLAESTTGTKDQGLLSINDSETSELLRSLAERNARPFTLDDPITSTGILIIGNSAVQRDELAEDHADKSHLQMWLPGYTVDRTEAAIYVWLWWKVDDWAAGVGYYVYLKHTSAGWQVVHVDEIWIT